MATRSAPGVIILGAPRSGTTLVRRLLNAHPNIACPGETYLLGACARFLKSERGAEGLDVGVLSGLQLAGFEREHVLQSLRDLVTGHLERYAERQGKPRWAEKSAFDAFHLDTIETLFGEHASFIVVQRHGLDVAASLQEFCDKTQGYLFELHDYVCRYPRPLAAFAHVWSDLTQTLQAFAARHPENVVTLRYEDLVAHTERELRRVLESIGESWSEGMIARALEPELEPGFGDWKAHASSSIESGSIGRYRELPSNLIAELAEIANPMLEACGYERVQAGGPIDSEEAQRRYQLGMLVQSLGPNAKKSAQDG